MKLYKEQREIVQSCVYNDETIVVAGNMLGKDYIAGLIVLSFFLTRHPCRVITTSVDHTQLESVLWGEMRRQIADARFPLEVERGGPLMVNHMHIRKVVGGRECGLSYIRGRVAARGEGMLGHHIAKTGDGIPRTLFVSDEASSVDDKTTEAADTWADRKLFIGNAYDCENHFKRSVKEWEKHGDLWSDDKTRCYRKVLRIRGQDSPNVRYALAEIAKGLKPSNTVILPGVLTYGDYQKRRDTWNARRQSIGLDARFYEDATNMLYPMAWLDAAERRYDSLVAKRRFAKGIGIDSAEGGDSTTMAASDELGLIELVSMKTADTSVITAEADHFARKHNVPWHKVLFDRGGGGKQHADRMRLQGKPVRSIGFGESPTLRPRFAKYFPGDREAIQETKYTYINKRAELYGELSVLLDPALGGWAIPREYTELRRQMERIPKLFDSEDRLRMLPKRRTKKDSKEESLMDLLGCSPDELDAVVLSVHAWQSEDVILVGAI